jgi:hypothetical protein
VEGNQPGSDTTIATKKISIAVNLKENYKEDLERERTTYLSLK